MEHPGGHLIFDVFVGDQMDHDLDFSQNITEDDYDFMMLHVDEFECEEGEIIRNLDNQQSAM